MNLSIEIYLSTLAFTSEKQSILNLPNPLKNVNGSLDYRK